MQIYTYDTIVVGSGAAGYNAACRLKQFGKKSVALVTEHLNWGTSRNTGSDKQTYYKLGLGGDAQDSVRAMAEDLFRGGSVDGDTALCEAALSVRCFMNLCELGVPFPVNRYGEYVGYKTDHDPYARATSAGPLTSKYMTEALQVQAEKLDVDVYSGFLGVEILKHEGRVCGLLCLKTEAGELAAFRCADINLATGGPAGIYADNVYPTCHTGSTGLALLAGAKAQNLTEWQYGLASVNPRWNVSGTYMQVLPRFISVDEHGVEHEFLGDYFPDPYEAMSMVFLKGYQWPFDSRKVLTGSSVIDLLVYRECVIRRKRVFLDYRNNPFGLESIEYEKLSGECRNYLERAGACFGTPLERLAKMNMPAVELYRSKGVDLAAEYLEIALCAQHNNGGISVDMWWQTGVRGLFAAGECAGTHGVARPGGSALNAGQVGSLRAAQYIAEHGNELIGDADFSRILSGAKQRHKAVHDSLLAEKASGLNSDVETQIVMAQRRMSDFAAAIRGKDQMVRALQECRQQMERMEACLDIREAAQIVRYYKLKDILVTQTAVLTAMIHYADTVGATRGSALYYDREGTLRQGLDECFRFVQENGESGSMVQEVGLTKAGFCAEWRPVRTMPRDENFFENVWRSFRENRNIY